ncbi:MAG TPA: hypothetical protein VH500_24045 [Nitrososphaeraceae archaeon]
MKQIVHRSNAVGFTICILVAVMSKTKSMTEFAHTLSGLLITSFYRVTCSRIRNPPITQVTKESIPGVLAALDDLVSGDVYANTK